MLFYAPYPQKNNIYKYYDSNSYKHKKIDYIERLTKDGYISEDYLKNRFETIGEPPEFMRMEDRVSYRNMCPEVNLFDNQFALKYAKNNASISGDYDRYEELHQRKHFTNLAERHYSECLEFSQFIFTNLDKKKISKYFTEKKKRRIPISNKLRIEIFQRDNFTCQYCGKRVTNGIKLEIDHKTPISEGGTDNFNNLLTACNECNSGKSNKII